MKKVANLDLATNYYLKKPSSGWVLAGLTNLEIFIFNMKDVPIGNPPLELPSHINDSKYIHPLTHHTTHNYPYNDNKCFFRCLALHQGARLCGLERLTNRLLSKFENHTDTSLRHGININHIPSIEIFFHVAINVYSLNQNGSADVIYLSRLPYDPMHINLYKNHFSYISNFKAYAKKFECHICQIIFNKPGNMRRHAETCRTDKEEVYIGGKFRRDKTLFERLEDEGIYIPEEHRFYPFVSVFDYESLQVRQDQVIRGRAICFDHVPATFSVCSNIPNHTDAIHEVSNGKPQELVDKMIGIQLAHQETASYLMRQKFARILEYLNETILELEENLEIAMNENLHQENKLRYRKIKSLLAGLSKYCDQLVVIGFNSQSYDLPLIR